MKTTFKTALMTAALTLISPIYAADTAATVPPAEQKKIESVVHSYLLKNPEVIVESMQALQQKQMDETRKQVESIQAQAPKLADALFHQANDPVAGNPNGTITIVDFFDYQCPHCITMTPILETVMKENPNVRVIFKDFPIRGPVSDAAAKAALAANMQGKYFEFHKALMQIAAKQELTDASIWQAAQTAGVNIEQLKKDMKSQAVADQLKNNYKLAQSMKLIWTPAFFIAKTDVKNNGQVLFLLGHIEPAQFKDSIQKLSTT